MNIVLFCYINPSGLFTIQTDFFMKELLQNRVVLVQ
jgi:hypothetical protein